MTEVTIPRETAYYYPEPYWLAQEGSWIKSLLLFFDEIAIMLPDYMDGRHVVADPTLARPLADQCLLRVLQPEWFVDQATTQKLTDVIESLITTGAFDSLDADHFAELCCHPSSIIATITDLLPPQKSSAPPGSGVASIVQVLPFHRSARLTCAPPPLMAATSHAG